MLISMNKIIIYRIFNFILMIAVLLSLSSCFKDDIPVKPFDRGSLKVRVVEMTPEYTNQFYYNFEQDQIISETHRDLWDIAFQGYGDDFYILLNGAKFMEAADMGNVEFESITNWSDALFKYDSTNGKYEDYSIGKWWNLDENQIFSKNHVYIINRGRDVQNKRVGYVKLKILSADSSEYIIRFADLDGRNEIIDTISKNQNYNYLMYSFDNSGATIFIEPERNKWDIMFTRYIAFLPYNNALLPYGVTGVMINHTMTEVAKDSITSFAEIQYSDIDKYNFSKMPGYIGHEWKNFELNGEVYTAKDYMNYIFKDIYGFYWKFRFIDFYNDDKQRGYPKFEFQKL